MIVNLFLDAPIYAALWYFRIATPLKYYVLCIVPSLMSEMTTLYYSVVSIGVTKMSHLLPDIKSN